MTQDTRFGPNGSRPISNFASLSSGKPITASLALSFEGPSSRGLRSEKKGLPEERSATWIRRWNAFKSRCPGLLVRAIKCFATRSQYPMHSTGTVGEYVAGVRYRAWQPPSCLHPTIGVHAPLVFDLYDNWNAKTVAGCMFHVSNPGGQNPTTFPINAYEAESRRLSRFSAYGHTPGSREPPRASKGKEFPFTLDLRRHSEA